MQSYEITGFERTRYWKQLTELQFVDALIWHFFRFS